MNHFVLAIIAFKAKRRQIDDLKKTNCFQKDARNFKLFIEPYLQQS